MRTSKIMILIAATCLSFVAVPATTTTQQPTTPRRSVFSSLKVGQSVTLKDRGSLYEIGTMDEAAPLAHRVVEIGDDYLVVRDDAEVVVLRIPATAVRAVIHVKVRGK